jgi:hypothetical protein
VAVHASLGRRDVGHLRLKNVGVAILAIEAKLINVNFMAIWNRLNRSITHIGILG